MSRLLAVASALVLVACAAEEHTVIIEFDPPELADRTDEIELTLTATKCDLQPVDTAGSPMRPVRRARITREKKQQIGQVDATSYGLYAVAIDNDCRFAAGCTDIALGGNSRNLKVLLRPTVPPRCVIPRDAGTEDTGTPIDQDAGPLPVGTELALSFETPPDGTSVTEESANRFVGTLKRGAEVTDEGHTGSGLFTPGGQAVLEFGPILPLTDALTVEAWVRPEAYAQWATFINRFYSNIGYWIGLSRDGRGVEFWVDISYAAGGPIELDEWTHVAGTFDADTGAVLLYLNGRQVGSNSHPFPVGVAQSAMSFGNAPEGVSSADFAPLVGTLDDIRVLSVVRSPEGICADAGGTWDGVECQTAGEE